MRPTIQQIAILIGATLLIGFFAWMTFEYFWPTKASWREVYDDSHIEVVYLPETTCSGNPSSCSTSIVPNYYTVCDTGHWQCVKGRDGSTTCLQARPTVHFCRRMRDF